MADTHVLEPRQAAAVRKDVTAPPAAVQELESVRRAAYPAYRLLHAGYVVLPLIAGLDKFTHWLVNWDIYLAPRVQNMLPVTGHAFMQFAGVVEIAAGLLVAVAPRVGGFVVAAWLWGIIVNLLMIPGYYDIALRDLGLSIGALALGMLANARLRPPVQTAAERGPRWVPSSF